MTTNFKHFPALFGEVVDQVKLKYKSSRLTPSFEYGTYFELMELCQTKDNNQQQKYPLIWLVWERGENEKKWVDDVIYSISPRVFICTFAQKDDTSAMRYENAINPVLHPMFDALIYELFYHPNMELGDDFKYNVSDHPFWLNNADGTFDILSAIEIKFENIYTYQL
jgi:hypothetical protein